MRKLCAGVLLLQVSMSLFSQNVGIGIITPRTKLHIYEGASGSSSFFAPLIIESNVHAYINFLTPSSRETGLLFGNESHPAHGGVVYNNPNNPYGLQFRTNGNTTRMVITSAGRVGIGTETPAAPLDISGANNWDLNTTEGDLRVGNSSYRLKMGVALGGGGAGAATIMQYGQSGGFNNLALGSQGKNYININGSNDYVDLTNLAGGLRINGNAGSAGQVIRSGGSGAAPSWTSISNWLFNNMYLMQQSGTTTISWPNSGTFAGMGHADFSLNVTAVSKLLLYHTANMKSVSCFACGTSGGYIKTDLARDGINFTSFSTHGNAANSLSTTNSGMMLYQIGPGTYTFHTYGWNEGGPSVEFSNAKLFIMLIPQ